MKKFSKKQWIKFSIAAVLYLLFTLWMQNAWLLLGLIVLVDIFLTGYIPWGAWKRTKNPQVRNVLEWVDDILFALVAVYFINIFIFQNYQIPSSSLEKSLLVGDYLFVSKLSYGPRVPNTPVAFPLVQNTLPFFNCKSYLDWPEWDYKRVKGLGHVKRNDIVVFNFPAGDTVALKVQNPDYYHLVEQYGREAILLNKADFGDVIYRPVDKRENYVKRCIGMPGDTIEIRDNQVYIDGVAAKNPEKMQLNYFVETDGSMLSEEQFRLLDVSKADRVLMDFYMGRTLDYEFSYGEEVTITPRNYEFDFRYAGKSKTHYALIGMAFVAGDYPLYYDAANEKGLGMAGLNFVGNAAYADEVTEVDKDLIQVAQYEFIPWILTQCASVAEARRMLSNMKLMGTPLQ